MNLFGWGKKKPVVPPQVAQPGSAEALAFTPQQANDELRRIINWDTRAQLIKDWAPLINGCLASHTWEATLPIPRDCNFETARSAALELKSVYNKKWEARYVEFSVHMKERKVQWTSRLKRTVYVDF